MSSRWQLDDGIESIRSAWEREHTERSVFEKMLENVCAENAKLRELCRCFAEYVSQDRCEGCVYKSRCNDGLVDECWQRTEIRKMARELGVEADG